MYRLETYQRVITRIHELRHLQRTTSDLQKRVELEIRIGNLKNLVTLHTYHS